MYGNMGHPDPAAQQAGAGNEYGGPVGSGQPSSSSSSSGAPRDVKAERSNAATMDAMPTSSSHAQQPAQAGMHPVQPMQMDSRHARDPVSGATLLTSSTGPMSAAAPLVAASAPAAAPARMDTGAQPLTPQASTGGPNGASLINTPSMGAYANWPLPMGTSFYDSMSLQQPMHFNGLSWPSPGGRPISSVQPTVSAGMQHWGEASLPGTVPYWSQMGSMQPPSLPGATPTQQVSPSSGSASIGNASVMQHSVGSGGRADATAPASSGVRWPIPAQPAGALPSPSHFSNAPSAFPSASATWQYATMSTGSAAAGT